MRDAWVHAIILAGGKGKRFFDGKSPAVSLPDGLSYPIPKGLFPVIHPSWRMSTRNQAAGGRPRKPVIQWLLEGMEAGGLEGVLIGTGYLHEKYRDFLEKLDTPMEIHVVPPSDRIDFERGPLFTLATVVEYIKENKFLERAGFDKVFLMCPSDLVVERRVFWHLAGPSARGMMASRARLHVVVEDRESPVNPGRSGSSLAELVPEKFRNAFDERALGWRLVPVMAVHGGILVDITRDLGDQAPSRVLDALRAWLEHHIDTTRKFWQEVNLVKASSLGRKFFWFDLDTLDVVVSMEKTFTPLP